MKISDTLIIGGGPAGLYASFYAGLRGMSVQIIEHHPELGGKLNIYPEKIIWDIGGIPPAPAQDIKNDMVEQAKTFNPGISVSTTCEAITKHEDYFEVITDNGIFYSKTIIIASGRGIFTPTRLKVEGADKFEISNLHYTVKRFARFKDRHVLISGGGNTAIDWAAEISNIAASVTMICRSDAMRGHEAMAEELHRRDIDIQFNKCIDHLTPNEAGDRIEYVVLDDGSQVAVDDVLVSHGYDSNCAFLEAMEDQFDFNEHQMLKTEHMVDTTVPGIFACGDQVEYDNKVRLIAGCFSEAAQAANHAKLFLDEDALAEGMVSSHNEVFAEKNKELMKKM